MADVVAYLSGIKTAANAATASLERMAATGQSVGGGGAGTPRSGADAAGIKITSTNVQTANPADVIQQLKGLQGRR